VNGSGRNRDRPRRDGHRNVTLLARITDHAQGLATPALYGVEVTTILSAGVDEPDGFARPITHLRSYLGAYAGAFRTGDSVHVAGNWRA
jgi:predicted nucleotidyltransferase